MSGRLHISGHDDKSKPDGNGTSMNVLAQIEDAEACYRAFLLSGEARQFLQETPGLGVAIPLLFIECNGMASSATGLVVHGALDSDCPELGFDLDGQFVLFSTKRLDAAEFITVNGWIGTSKILARRQDAVFTLPPRKGSRS